MENVSLFYLWAEEARLVINRIKQLDVHSSSSETKSTPTPSKIEDDQSELHQRIQKMRIFPNPNLSPDDDS